MKKTLLLFLSLCMAMMLHAQVPITITNNAAGNLATALGANLTTCTSLTVTGDIDAQDFLTLHSMYSVSTIDLSGTTIVEYSGVGGSAGSNFYTYAANAIPVNAFSNIYFLTSVILPNSATSIGNSAFWYCNYLTSVSIPNSVTTIGDYAFNSCDKLTSVSIPNSVTTIGVNAFENCFALNTVTIPNSVTTIGYSAFKQCKCTINVAADNITYSSIDGVLYNKTQTELMFCPTSKTGSIVIPNSVTTIDDWAFYYCTGLTSVSIPNSVATIGGIAFSGSSCFMNVDANNTTYSSIDGVLYNKTQTQLIHCPISKTGSFVIPNTVTTIVGDAFWDCTGLTTVSIPNSVTTIGQFAFYNCNHLTSVSLPNSVTTIGGYSFGNCTRLTSVSIPNSVTAINYFAFSECTSLTSITINNPSPIDLTNRPQVFYRVNKTNCTLFVPTGSKTAYQAPTATQWNEFTNIVELTPTAINTPKTSNVTIVVTANQLAITNAPQGEMVVVYNLAGSVIYSQEVTNSKVEVELPKHGVYIVKVGTLSKKVVY